MSDSNFPRLFVGIGIPGDLKQEIATRQPTIDRPNKVKWTKVENLHLTTCFIGQTERSEAIKDQLYELSKLHKPFEIKIKQVHKAPPKKPYMIWATFVNNIHYNELALDTQQKILGETSSSKDPIPHLTLARFKFLKEESFLDAFQDLSGYSFRVDGFHLWESVRKPEGPEYTKLASYSLLDT